MIVTASIDTTCTVWDLNTLHAKTHLIAHDKEVFDVAFVAGSEHIFASCGADGSVRMFDLRYLFLLLSFFYLSSFLLFPFFILLDPSVPF